MHTACGSTVSWQFTGTLSNPINMSSLSEKCGYRANAVYQYKIVYPTCPH